MKAVLVTLMTLLIFASACQKDPQDSFREANSRETIKNLELSDPDSPKRVSHPLMCVEAGDYPNGVEMVLQKNDDDKWIHAVFPEGVKAPAKVGVEIVLKGFFQEIQNRDRFEHNKLSKQPAEDYQYFVVTSWEKQK